MDQDESERAILAMPATKLVVYTDSKGAILRTIGPESAAPDLGVSLDIAAAAAEQLGQRTAVGSLRLGVMSYDGALLLFRVLPREARVYVVADADFNHLGLLLSHLRAIRGPMGEEAGA